jgi:TP901 family phage tail tape measure protein
MSRQSIQAGKAVIVIDLADQATAKFSGLVKTMSAKMMQASRSLRDTALNSTAGFIVTKMAVGSLVKDFISFEDRILNLTAKLGFFGNKTTAQTKTIQDLEKYIMYLGRTTSFTSQEVADAGISLAQAGFSADELKASLKGTLDFARGTNYALGESADMVANLVRTFNLFGANDTLEQRTSKITLLTSQLVKATRLGTVEIQDLRESLKYAGGSAQTLGIQLPVVLGFLLQMSESELKASIGGSSLNVALLNLIKSSKKLQAIDPTFEIVTDAEGNENLMATMAKLYKISNKLNKVKRVELFQDIFNIRGGRTANATQELDRIDNFIKQLQNAGAESTLAASLMESGAGGATRRFTSAIETLRISIMKLYANEFTAFNNALAFLTTKLEASAGKVKGLILAFLLSPVIFGATAIGAMTLSFVLARLARALQLVATAGRGLKFLGGSLLSAAKGTASLFGPKGPSRSAQIATQMKSVAKLQSKINAMTAAAQGKKTAGGRVKAMAAVTNSKSMQKLVATTQKLQSLQKLPANSLLGMLGKFAQSAKQIIPLTQKMAGVVNRSAKAFVARQKAIKTNALMNSAIRGEQMIALKAERAMQAQIAKVSAPVKPTVAKQSVLPNMSAKRAGELKNINNTLIQVAKNEGRLARFAGIQERTYDRLYKVRKEIAALEAAPIEQIIGAKAGKRTPLTQQALRQQEVARQAKLASLRAREAKMAAIVNKNVGPQQAFFAKQREKLQSIFNQRQKVAGIEQVRAQANVQKSLNAKAATQTASRQARQAATVKRLQTVQQGQRVASEMKIATLRSRLTNVKGARSMIGGGLSSLATKAGGGIAAGFKSLKGMMSGAGLVKAGQGILTLAGGFLKLAGSVTKFVFSWNFVGMVFNILLMFGDKIPAVVAAFNALGTGISGAFGEMGKVFAYAAPAMKLFQLAFNAFLQGDTGTGVAALQTAFSGIVDIIGNQLVAAWNTFMESVGYLWTTLQQVFMSIKNIIMSIFEGITKIFGVVASPIFSSLQDIFGAATGGAAGGGLQSFAMKFVQGLDYFITRFFQGAIFLHQQLMEFVAEFQRVIGQIISEIPGTGQSGAAIQRDAQTTKSMAEMRSSMARGSLESSMKQRQKDLANIFSVDTAANARQRNMVAGQANGRSSQTSVDMVHAMTVLSDQFAQNMRDRTDEINRLQQGKPSTPGQPGQGVADQLTTELPKYLQALTGSAMSTRAIYRVDTKRQEDIMKDQLKAQQETNRLLSLGGGVP